MKDKFWKGWVFVLTVFVIIYGMAMESRNIELGKRIDGVYIATHAINSNFRKIDYYIWQFKNHRHSFFSRDIFIPYDMRDVCDVVKYGDIKCWLVHYSKQRILTDVELRTSPF